MNKVMRKQIREIVNLVMDLNDLGAELQVKINNDALSIIDFNATGKGFYYLGNNDIYFTGECWEPILQSELDAALLKLKKDLASRK